VQKIKQKDVQGKVKSL